MEALLAFCQLSTEWHVSQCGSDGMRFVTIPTAYHIWRYIEDGARAYQGYTTLNPDWIATFCPTALKKANRDRLKATQPAIQGPELLVGPSPADGPLTPVLSTELDQLRGSPHQHELTLQQAVTEKAPLQEQLQAMQGLSLIHI